MDLHRTFLYGTFCLLLECILNLISINGLAIDNEIKTTPELDCREDTITFRVATRNPFTGNIYIKSKFHDANCRKEFYANTANEGILSVKIPLCGMQRIRQLQPQGMNYILVFVVTFHAQFVTKVDRAFNVRCFYAQQDKTVSSLLEVSMLSTQNLELGILLMPNCQYSIRANTLNGPQVKYIRVGDRLVHRWECDNVHFGMLIKNCFVNDGYGSSVRVVDTKGCPVMTPVIQGPLQYDNNLNLAYVEVWAYKFPDRSDLYFQCQVQVCNKREQECVGITPPNCPTTKTFVTPANIIDTNPPVIPGAYRPQAIVNTLPSELTEQNYGRVLPFTQTVEYIANLGGKPQVNVLTQGYQFSSIQQPQAVFEGSNKQQPWESAGSNFPQPSGDVNQEGVVQVGDRLESGSLNHLELGRNFFSTELPKPKRFTFVENRRLAGILRESRKKRQQPQQNKLSLNQDYYHTSDSGEDRKTLDVASGVVYVAEVGDLNSNEDYSSFPIGSPRSYENDTRLICLTPFGLTVLFCCFLLMAFIILLFCLYSCCKSEYVRKYWPSLTTLSTID